MTAPVPSVENSTVSLDDLRRARRRNRIAQLDKFDAFYKAYVTGLSSALAIYAIAGAFGDAPIVDAGLARLERDGPAYIGLLVVFVVSVGLRSGGRGGPLAFERAEIRHVLMAPVDRVASVRGPAIRLLRHGLFVGAVTGGACGIVAVRRLPEMPVSWIVCGALFGAAVAATACGAAMALGGLRVRAWVADVLAVLALGWTGADVIWHLTTSPFTWLGHVAVWPLGFDIAGLGGLLFAAVVGVVGLAWVQGLSMEAAERRSRLVGQLRFAATLQDVRTVMVLQRQLAQEHLRTKPWFRLPRPRSRKTRSANGAKVLFSVFYRRSANDLLRWPLFRVVRLVAMVVAAVLSAWGVWAGTSALVVVGGLALWFMALDLLEPLAQESDHADRLQSFPRSEGMVLSRLLVVPFCTLLLLLVVASSPILLGANTQLVGALWPLVVIAAWLAIGGGALAVIRKPSVPSGSIQVPEIAGLQFLWRALAPPSLAILAFVPLIIARNSWTETHSVEQMLEAVNLPLAGILALGSWAVAWVRYGPEMQAKLTAMGARAVSDPPKNTTGKAT